MSTVPAEVHGPSDAELIESVRNGTVAAYGSLYQRHVGAAYNLARQLSRSQAEADDLVSEAFAKVLDTLRAGRGPDSAFRAYLLTALRHTAYDKTRRDKKVELSEDVTTIAGADTAVPFSDTAVAGLERSLAARAFARLPERWQAVLWHTEVEGQSPAEVAPLLGLTPNGVSALAYRAREGLRQAYLQVHLAESDNERCRATAERLGAWTRGGLSKRETAQVEAHLDECERCRVLAAELADVNSGLRGIIAPLVLGVGALGYLATTTAKAGSAVVAGVAAGSATGAAGAASSLPRQFIGVAASATALAAAIAIALTSGGQQELPIAQPAPAPTTQTQRPTLPNIPPVPPVPPPPVPPPPQNTPTQPSATPAPTPTPTPTTAAPSPSSPTVTTQPTSPTTPPPPPPRLSAPTIQPITVVPGTSPVDMPITVSNTGGSVSEPILAALNLPEGVSAVGTSRFSTGPMLRLNAAPPPSSVQCPGGTGTVVCTNGRGLEPGESTTLLFRIDATEDSPGGTITGFVSAGSSLSVPISVKVDVKPIPKKDGVSIYAFRDWLDFPVPGRHHKAGIVAIATNTGESTKQVTISFDQPVERISAWPAASCTPNGATANCVTHDNLKPGDRFYLRVSLSDPSGETRKPQGQSRKVLVTATLGTASARTTVKLPWWSWPDPPPKPTTTKPTPTKPTRPTETTRQTTPTSPTTETKPGDPTKPTEPTKAPPEETKPTTTSTRTQPPPEPSDCDSLSDVERLLAVLTGRCPASEGPAPR
ncbi:RNA polymerase sigma factor (sigma-70 family) [Kibdelosporangium banguiense]|uniref:RNA polymerase sigma factor (Sigma-70 family) n=1 Tax=Kibdelosporangium banguiense TaxID=1365924 RepID=A0ABS4TEI2_9PSEU|nr:sigma-70 family RNA polymerase sigma factor [Kibdelosporangium banguiense]MBP2322813.1 RNA polymerase sigma factor (sigma-70 family) [Kibdelosporangium banguiense]